MQCFNNDDDSLTFQSDTPKRWDAIYNHSLHSVIFYYEKDPPPTIVVMENYKLLVTTRIDGRGFCFYVCGEVLGNGNLCGEVIVIDEKNCVYDTWFYENSCKHRHRKVIFHLCHSKWYVKRDYYCETCEKRGIKFPYRLLSDKTYQGILAYVLMLMKMNTDKTIATMRQENENLKHEIGELANSVTELKEMLMFCVGSKEFLKARDDFESLGKKE